MTFGRLRVQITRNESKLIGIILTFNYMKKEHLCVKKKKNIYIRVSNEVQRIIATDSPWSDVYEECKGVSWVDSFSGLS